MPSLALFCGEITQNHADNEGRHPGDHNKGVGRGADGRSPKGLVDDGEKKDEIPCVPCRDSQNSLKALCVVGLIAPGVINHHPVGAGVQSSQRAGGEPPRPGGAAAPGDRTGAGCVPRRQRRLPCAKGAVGERRLRD